MLPTTQACVSVPSVQLLFIFGKSVLLRVRESTIVGTWRAVVVVALLQALVACGSSTVVHEVDEREANRIIEILDKEKITATKGMVDTGRSVHFTISVPASQRLEAIRTLNQHELPARADRGYEAVFSEGGLIPTNSEERAKFLSAIEGEIQRQLKVVDGILHAEVQIVMPTDSALRTTKDQQPATTASVTLKYMPGATGTKPLVESQVQAIVAAGVEKLTTDNVVVVMTPSGAPRKTASAASKNCKGSGWCAKIKPKYLNMISLGVVGLVLLLALGLVYGQLRLKSVRGRLIRLQTEIARARRKPGESSTVG